MTADKKEPISLPEEFRDGGTLDLDQMEPYGYFHPVTGELIKIGRFKSQD